MNRLFRRALPILILCSLAAAAPAQTPEPVVVGRFSVASLDAFNKFSADLGFPTAPDSGLKSMIESLPFMGPGTLASDKPFGVSVVAGDPHKLFPFQDSLIASMPVLPGKVTVADLTARGATLVEGTADTLKIDPVTGRRTADYFHTKQVAGTFGLSAMTDTLFAADFKDASNLFVLTADFAGFRKAAPDAYKELAKQVTSFPRMFGLTTPDDPKPVESVLDKMDKFTLALGQDDANLHLKSWLAPSPLSTKAREAPRPAFPAGMMMRMHVVYPTPEAAAFVEKQLAALPEDSFGMGLPPAFHERAKALVLKAAALNSRTDALSVAFAMKDGKPVVYIVDQLNADVDAIKEITAIANDGVALGAEGAGAKVKLDTSTYTAGANKVLRLVFTPEAAAAAGGGAGGAGGPGAPAIPDKLVIDEIQTGRTLFLTFASNPDGKYVADLAAAGLDGKSSVLCAGALDLTALLTATLESGAGMPGVTPDQLQKLKAGWAGQGITWTVQSSVQNFLYTDVQVPKQVIRDLVKMYLTPQPQPPQPTPNLP